MYRTEVTLILILICLRLDCLPLNTLTMGNVNIPLHRVLPQHIEYMCYALFYMRLKLQLAGPQSLSVWRTVTKPKYLTLVLQYCTRKLNIKAMGGVGLCFIIHYYNLLFCFAFVICSYFFFFCFPLLQLSSDWNTHKQWKYLFFDHCIPYCALSIKYI